MFARSSLVPSRLFVVLRSSSSSAAATGCSSASLSSFRNISNNASAAFFVAPPRGPLLVVSGKQHDESSTTKTAISRCWKSTSSSSSSVATAAAAASRKRIAIPPNLKIDPRSSFAPSLNDDLLADEDEETTTRGDEDEQEEEPDTEAAGEQIDKAAAAISSKEKQQQDDQQRRLQRYLAQEEVAYAIPLPERLHVDVHTLFAPAHSSHVGTFWLEETVFGRDPIRVDLMKRAVDYYRAKKRGRRKAKTKTIAEVSGSGRKIRQQKGTGMARAGHSRPPHFRGGAKAHGPKNTTDYGKTKLNKKVRRQALAHALSQKLKEGNLLVFDQLYRLESHKTNYLASLLEPWGIGNRNGTSALILDHYYPPKQDDNDSSNSNNKASEQEEESNAAATSHGGVPINFWVASRNIYNLKVGSHHAANVYDILKYEKLVLTLGAIQMIERRLKDV